ncbi:MAG: hypothetical protein J7559_04810, partial [Cohnella sp.]|nr:hypothetical protein [Cohnella sp.]
WLFLLFKEAVQMSQGEEIETSATGRKKLWDTLDMPSKLTAVRGWAMQGSLDTEICEMLGIGKTTFYEWKNDYPEFAEAVKKGKDIANGELLNSAFTQATGFMYTEQQAVKVKDFRVIVGDNGEPKYEPVERVELVDVQKFALPNPTMNIFMLKNRLPQHYKDKQQIEHSGGVQQTIKHDLSKLSDEELETFERLLSKSTESE